MRRSFQMRRRKNAYSVLGLFGLVFPIWYTLTTIISRTQERGEQTFQSKIAFSIDKSAGMTNKFMDSTERKTATSSSSAAGKAKTVPMEHSSVNSLSLERKENCNLQNLAACRSSQKSLVLTFWTERSRNKWLSRQLLTLFPEKYYDYVIMVHDNSTWTNHEAFKKAIWIFADIQQKFWFIKRFIPMHILKAYRYVWIIDDDAHPLFNPRHYECVTDAYNISLSSPVYAGPIQGIHRITHLMPEMAHLVGRWTDFVEIGPLVMGQSSAWQCLWNLFSPAVGLGFGLDNVWCRYLSLHCMQHTAFGNVCAILDVFGSYHDSPMGMTSGALGARELPAYDAFYPKYGSKFATFGAVAKNLSIYNSCNVKTLS